MAAETVSVLAASSRCGDFDARFSAIGRHYLYRIVNRRSPLALEAKKAWWVTQGRSTPRRCTSPRKRWSAGTTSPPSARCNARPRARSRRSTGSTSTRNGEAIEIRASARSFLHNQVRSMVGSLKRVGEGAWMAADLAAALEAARPRRLRTGRAARRALSHEGRLPQRLIRLRAARRRIAARRARSARAGTSRRRPRSRWPLPCRARHWSSRQVSASERTNSTSDMIDEKSSALGTNMRSSVGGSIIQMISAEPQLLEIT